MKRTFPKLAVVLLAAFFAVVALVVILLHGNTPRVHAHPRAQDPPHALPVIDTHVIRWVGYHGYQLPTSPDGPRNTPNGLTNGYAHSPLGSLMAAINIAARSSWQFGPGIFEPTIQSQVTGQYQQELLANDLANWDSNGQQPPQVTSYASAAGFEWLAYTPSDATVDFLESFDTAGSPTYAATKIQVQWAGGDWQLVAPPGGSWDDASTQVVSLAGYNLFLRQGG